MAQKIKSREGEIWAIGGGKGGTGKTFFACSTGAYLAKNGRQVVLVDMDLGGANLHSFFGLSRPEKSLTSFFETGASLADLVTPTGQPNISLVSGDIYSIASDKITFNQQLKLFRQIMKINAQNVVIDLGAGSHNNTLDTFLIADKMVVILAPEVISIENMYHFIKNSLFRKIKKTLKDYGFKEVVQHIWDRRQSYGITNLRELIDYLRENFPYMGTILDNELAAFRIHLVLNMVRTNQDVLLGASIKSVMNKYLGIPISYAGYIEYNDEVWKSIRERKPFMLHYSTTASAKDLETTIDNIGTGREISLGGGL
jgi:flagellar biosynthesis protein FlhG